MRTDSEIRPNGVLLSANSANMANSFILGRAERPKGRARFICLIRRLFFPVIISLVVPPALWPIPTLLCLLTTPPLPLPSRGGELVTITYWAFWGRDATCRCMTKRACHQLVTRPCRKRVSSNGFIRIRVPNQPFLPSSWRGTRAGTCRPGRRVRPRGGRSS